MSRCSATGIRLGSPILEDTRALDYVNWGWLLHIRDFLDHIKGQIHGATPKPPLYREHDSYIMDSTTIKLLSRQDRAIIQRCRIYLQIATISDIASHDGTRINPTWMTPTSPKPSISQLQWPKQGNPGRRAWTLWARVIKAAFTNKYGRLKCQLGNWTRTNPSRKWVAYISVNPTRLHQYTANQWAVHAFITKQRRNCIFAARPLRTEPTLPTDAIPIDILHQDDERIITDLIQFETIQGYGTGPLTLRDGIAQSEYNTLLETYDLLLDENYMRQTLLYPSNFEISSDGSHATATRIASYGWTVSLNRQLLAKGKGPVPAHPDMANPFRAETYGVAAVLAFLNVMQLHYCIDPKEHNWKLYIDNKTLIRKMQEYDNYGISAKSTLQPDADITTLTYRLKRPFPILIEHITSKKIDSNSTDDDN